MLSNGLPANVTAVADDAVTLDLNHELAGKHLTFDVELLSLTTADSLQKATFGAGCFWGPELAFQRVAGEQEHGTRPGDNTYLDPAALHS